MLRSLLSPFDSIIRLLTSIDLRLSIIQQSLIISGQKQDISNKELASIDAHLVDLITLLTPSPVATQLGVHLGAPIKR